MWQKCYLGFVFIIHSAALVEALKKCSAEIRSTYGDYLSGHVISTKTFSSLYECIMMCSSEFRCKSMNFLVHDKSCDLNDADRHTHPEDHGPREGSVYMDTSVRHKKKGGLKSCAEIHQYFPQAESGYYWIKIGGREAQVYCDMDNHGGGWTLVVSISSKNNDHLQRNSNNGLNSIMCVAFNVTDVTSRKLSDGDIHELAQNEGTFRVDSDPANSDLTVFYQIPSGPGNFDSSCSGIGEDCPRIIISYSHPYQWETNPCTTVDVGYRIYRGCHRVFDAIDDHECGSQWWSSQFSTRRVMYGFPCPGNPTDSFGIYRNLDGMLYVK